MNFHEDPANERPENPDGAEEAPGQQLGSHRPGGR